MLRKSIKRQLHSRIQFLFRNFPWKGSNTPFGTSQKERQKPSTGVRSATWRKCEREKRRVDLSRKNKSGERYNGVHYSRK